MHTMMHHRLLRKGTLEKLQKIPPKVAIFTMKQHYTKKNKYTECGEFIGTSRFSIMNWIDIVA